MTHKPDEPAEQPPIIALHWLPTNPPRPCPDLLTADETILYLRLNRPNMGDSSKPRRTLSYYRNTGKLKGTQVGRNMAYRLVDIHNFLDSLGS